MACPDFLLGTVAVAVAQLMEHALEPIGLHRRHFWLLLFLASGGPRQQSALSWALGVDRTTVVALVDFLEQHQLARRVREKEDRRAYVVRLTPKGAALTRQATAVVNTIEEQMFAPLTPNERETLLVLFMRLLTAPGPIADTLRGSRRQSDSLQRSPRMQQCTMTSRRGKEASHSRLSPSVSSCESGCNSTDPRRHGADVESAALR
jgi:MarR family transcriptional regulator, lower aerobic nicotinate degradation pathway regulator